MSEALATIGDNQPPADADPLRERLTSDYADLVKRKADLLEAADRVPDTIEDDDTAGKVADFIKQLMACTKSLNSHRTSEKEPYLAGGRTVDGFFKGLAEPLDKKKKVIEARLTTYQRQKAEEERRAREAVEKRAQEEAARLQREAEEKAAAMQDDSQLEDAVSSAEQAQAAREAAAIAERNAHVKAADLSRARGDYGSVASLRTFWDFRELNRDTLDLETLRQHLPQAALEQAVRSFVKAGGRTLSGVVIFENANTVVR